jgi:hypothetical protein
VNVSFTLLFRKNLELCFDSVPPKKVEVIFTESCQHSLLFKYLLVTNLNIGTF